MQTEQITWTASKGWSSDPEKKRDLEPQFLLVFSSGNILQNDARLADIQKMFPKARIIGCSTSGEIASTRVTDESISLTAVKMDKSVPQFASVHISDPGNSFDAGMELISKLPAENLRHVFVLSDGLHVNGSELVKGLRNALPDGVSVTGGLAGDGTDFKQTFVINSEGKAESQMISAIGFYGDQLHIGYGSFGGWDSFGLERKVTRSDKNVLFEIDNQPALALYKIFLGEKAAELPSSGLLFPLSMRLNENDQPVVRTILGINEADQSITFAGDIPEGALVQLMKANTDRLVLGAGKAAGISLNGNPAHKPELALLISCVGRKLVLKQMVEEEVEGVRAVFGEKTTMAGFYSYGEISPFSSEARCELHNQTMTITTFYEI
jgi:hypothetical protein